MGPSKFHFFPHIRRTNGEIFSSSNEEQVETIIKVQKYYKIPNNSKKMAQD